MRAALLIIIGFVSATLQAEVYKWVDDKGIVHYGDKQNTEGRSVEMQVDMSSPDENPENANKETATLSRDEKRRRLAGAMEEDRLEKKEAREKKKAERDQNKRQCNQLKDKKKRRQAAAVLYKLDKDGNRVVLSDEQRSKNQKSLDKQIKKYCR